MIAVRPGEAWYSADTDGSIGVVELGSAAGISSTLTPVTTPITPTCNTLAAASPSAVSTRFGTLVWATGTYTATTSSGITKYELAADVTPYGIAASRGSVWFVDENRRKLEKLWLGQWRVYLPLLHR
jgi:hypothetical protein